MQLEDPRDLIEVHAPGVLRIYSAHRDKTFLVDCDTITNVVRVGHRTTYVTRSGRGQCFFLGHSRDDVMALVREARAPTRKVAELQNQATNLQLTLPWKKSGSADEG